MKGFTLIEILVSLSIVGVLLATGIPAFRSYGNTAQLTQAARDVEVSLLEARNFALAPPAENTNLVTHFGIRFEDAGPGTYALIAVNADLPPNCLQANPTSCQASVIQTRSLPQGISFVDPPRYAWFSILRQGEVVLDPVDNDLALVTSKRVSGSATVELVINPVTGQVTIGAS